MKQKLLNQQTILNYYYYCVQVFKKNHEHEERNGTYLKEADRTFRDKNRSNFPE